MLQVLDGAIFNRILVMNPCRLLAVWLLQPLKDSYLVDPASSHMLVSKIKPCMSKYKQICTVKLRMAHYISHSLFDGTFLHG
jgi:hypothetical protein